MYILRLHITSVGLIPTEEQYNFCIKNMSLFVGIQDEIAMNKVMNSYAYNEKCSHKFLKIVNQKMSII